MKGRNIKDNSDFWLDYWVGGSTPPPPVDMGETEEHEFGNGRRVLF